MGETYSNKPSYEELDIPNDVNLKYMVYVTYTTSDGRVIIGSNDFDSNTFKEIMPLITYIGVGVYAPGCALYQTLDGKFCGQSIKNDYSFDAGKDVDSIETFLKNYGLLGDEKCLSVAGVSIICYGNLEVEKSLIPCVYPIGLNYNVNSLTFNGKTVGKK